MLFVDVNVLLYAHRPDLAHHLAVGAWLDEARRQPEPIAIPSVVVSGFLRVATNPRVFHDPSTPAVAWAFLRDIIERSRVVEPGPRHLDLFEQLCLSLEIRANLVPDAYLAAMAIEARATMVSTDRDFTRFSGLKLRHPLDPR